MTASRKTSRGPAMLAGMLCPALAFARAMGRPYFPARWARASTSALKARPRSSNEPNSSKEAQAGESSTTSPAAATESAASKASSKCSARRTGRSVSAGRRSTSSARPSWCPGFARKPEDACFGTRRGLGRRRWGAADGRSVGRSAGRQNGGTKGGRSVGALRRLKSRRKAPSRLAEAHDGLGVAAGSLHERSQVGALVASAEKHDGAHVVEGRKGLERGIDVGGLRVVHAPHARHAPTGPPGGARAARSRQARGRPLRASTPRARAALAAQSAFATLCSPLICRSQARTRSCSRPPQATRSVPSSPRNAALSLPQAVRMVAPQAPPPCPRARTRSRARQASARAGRARYGAPRRRWRPGRTTEPGTAGRFANARNLAAA